jgi:predicted nucleotidyltransferase component of viral defense system
VLTPEQQRVLREIGSSATQRGFYLAGGAALGLHLGHRRSVDLDWFTGERIENPLELARDLQDRGLAIQVDSAQQKTLHGDVRGVRVSFFEYRYPVLMPPLNQSDLGCVVASLEDLAAMKLLAVAQRGAKKDFLDIHALGQHGLSLGEMLALFRRKFAVEDVSRVLYSLCYFEDADPDPMPTMHTAVTWDRAKADIRTWVKAAANAAD